MEKTQSNIWLTRQAKTLLAQWAEQEHHSQSDIVEALIRAEAARRSGEIIEEHSLPIIRDIVSTELRKQLAEQRVTLNEDMDTVLDEVKAMTGKSDNRLAGIMMRVTKDVVICRRLIYTHLSRVFSPEFALHAYEDAREKAGKELANRRVVKEGEA